MPELLYLSSPLSNALFYYLLEYPRSRTYSILRDPHRRPTQVPLFSSPVLAFKPSSDRLDVLVSSDPSLETLLKFVHRMEHCGPRRTVWGCRGYHSETGRLWYSGFCKTRQSGYFFSNSGRLPVGREKSNLICFIFTRVCFERAAQAITVL
jgi:hypothetical protein